MFVIDGKKVSSREFGNIRQEDVAIVQVLKGAMARSAYSDPAAVNGVVVIETKAAKKH